MFDTFTQKFPQDYTVAYTNANARYFIPRRDVI